MRSWSLFLVVVIAVASIVASKVLKVDDYVPDQRPHAHLELWIDNHADAMASVYLNFPPGSDEGWGLRALLPVLGESLACEIDTQGAEAGSWEDARDLTTQYLPVRKLLTGVPTRGVDVCG